MRADNKAVILGDKINVHHMRPYAEGGENGGDSGEPEPGREVSFSDMPLTKKQFEELVGQGAFDSFFNQTKNSPLEPAFASFKKIKLDGKFKNCWVKYTLGHTAPKDIELDGATIKGLAISFPQACNERACALLSGTVQGIFPRSNATLEMETYAGKEVRMSMRLGEVEEEAEDDKERQEDMIEKDRRENPEGEESASRKDKGDEQRPH